MSKSNRASRFTKEQRILTVQGWIIDGAQDDFIIRQMKQEWDLGTRQCIRYLRTAYGNWKQNADISIEDRRAAKVAELKQLRRSLKAEYMGTPQGINAVGRIEKQIIKLEGLEPVKRLDLTSKGESIQPVDNRTPEERDARIKELIEKHNADQSRSN